MALTFGSMDQQVQQQADAFSDNPAALQQRYQQSQQLLDLLALQKLKSDKEAAAREMQMQMEQRPQTIAQQREAEVMGLTKDELAKQMGGIMAQRQAVEQSNIKRAASGQPPRQRMAMAPPMRNPRTEGVASQRADNMVNMAQGGVVGFEPGGRVEGGQVQALLNELGIPEDIYNSRPELKAKIDAIIAGRGEGSRYGRDVGDPAALRRALSAEADKARRRRPIGGAETLSYLFGTQEGYRDLQARNAAAQKQEDLFRGAAQRSGTALSSLSPPPNAAPNAAVPGSLAGLEASALGDMYAPGPAAPAAPVAPPPALAAPATGITTVPRVATPTFGDYRAQEAAIGDSYRKQGILKELEGGAKRRSDLYAQQQAARNPLDWTAGLRGGGGLGAINRAMQRQKYYDQGQDQKFLNAELADITGRLGVEEKISGAQITGATNRIKYATDIAIANANNETKAAVSKVAADASNYAAQLTARYQNATTENQKRKLVIDAENAKTKRISDLLKLRDAQIQGLLLSPEYASADSEERKVIRKRLEDTYKPLLLEVRRQFDRISGKSSLPSSADGAAMRKTSP